VRAGFADSNFLFFPYERGVSGPSYTAPAASTVSQDMSSSRRDGAPRPEAIQVVERHRPEKL